MGQNTNIRSSLVFASSSPRPSQPRAAGGARHDAVVVGISGRRRPGHARAHHGRRQPDVRREGDRPRLLHWQGGRVPKRATHEGPGKTSKSVAPGAWAEVLFVLASILPKSTTLGWMRVIHIWADIGRKNNIGHRWRNAGRSSSLSKRGQHRPQWFSEQPWGDYGATSGLAGTAGLSCDDFQLALFSLCEYFTTSPLCVALRHMRAARGRRLCTPLHGAGTRWVRLGGGCRLRESSL